MISNEQWGSEDTEKYKDIERLIAEQGLPETRDDFDRNLLLTIESLERVGEIRQGRVRQKSRRSQRLLIVLCAMLLCSNCLSYSIGRRHSLPVSGEQDVDQLVTAAVEMGRMSDNAIPHQLIQIPDGEETVWGQLAQLENISVVVQTAQQSTN